MKQQMMLLQSAQGKQYQREVGGCLVSNGCGTRKSVNALAEGRSVGELKEMLGESLCNIT